MGKEVCGTHVLDGLGPVDVQFPVRVDVDAHLPDVSVDVAGGVAVPQVLGERRHAV